MGYTTHMFDFAAKKPGLSMAAISETFSRLLRGMHHKRIKYHNDLVQELDKNNKLNRQSAQQIVLDKALDKAMDAKIKELEQKKSENETGKTGT